MFSSLWNAFRNTLSALDVGPSPSLKEIHVRPLTSLEALDACLSASEIHPLFIFKHSTACPLSAEAFRHVAAYATGASGEQPEVYLVKVIEDRPVSNQIAQELQVPHKSPQLILVKDRKAAWSASHYGINPGRIEEAVTVKS